MHTEELLLRCEERLRRRRRRRDVKRRSVSPSLRLIVFFKSKQENMTKKRTIFRGSKGNP